MQRAADANPSSMVSVLGITAGPQKVHDLCAEAAKASNSKCFVSNELCLGNTTISGSHAACDKVTLVHQREGKK